MNHPARNFAFAFSCSIVACAFFPATQAQAAPDKIIAVVNDEVVTQKDLNDFANFMSMEMENGGVGADKEARIAELKPKLLAKLIEDRLIAQEAKQSGLKADESRIRDRVAQIRKRYGSDALFQQSLASQGISQAELEQRMREQFLTYAIIEQKVKKGISVNPREVTDYYQKNAASFMRKEVREFQAVHSESEAAASRIAQGLRSGASPEILAKQESAAVQVITASQGKELRPEVEKAAFSLPVGGVSDPIEIGGQYYVFRLNSITPARPESLEEAQEEIYAFLMDSKLKSAMEKWLAELKGRSYIKIME